MTLSNCPLIASQGSGYVIIGFAERLRALGHDVDLAGPDAVECWPTLKGRAKSYRLALGMLLHVREMTRRGARPDVVEMYGGEAWLATRYLKRRRHRPLLVAHSNGIETHVGAEYRARQKEGVLPPSDKRWYHFDTEPLVQDSFRLADAIVTVSEFDADFASRMGYQPAGRILVVENSLPDEFLGLPIELDREKVLMYCGAWHYRKNTATMERDVARFLRGNPEWRFRAIGVGDGFDPAAAFGADLSARIEVFPMVHAKAELRKLYESSAILVLPSLYESFGLVTAEALACGCAVIATPTGFAAGLRDRHEVLLMKSFESPALYEALTELAADDVMRQRIAEQGHARVQGLRWPDAVAKLESAYRRWAQELADERESCCPD